jgi:hypothetical protein
VAAAPVAALVAVADVAKAVIDTAIVADILAPVARIKPVMVMPVAPVSGRPESALVRSLNPSAGHPVIAVCTPGPVAGRPEITVAGSRRLVVVGHGRRRLGSCIFRLLSVPRIIITLIRRLGIGAVPIRRRSALLSVGTRRRGRVRSRRDGGRVVGSRVRRLILRAWLAVIRSDQAWILVASGGENYHRQGKQWQLSKSEHPGHFTLHLDGG